MNYFVFNKQNMKFLGFFLTLLMLGSSCTKEIPVDENYQSSRLVLNSVFNLEDDTLKAFITQTQRIAGFTSDYTKINDAKIYLHEKDRIVGEFVVNDVVLDKNQYTSGYGTRYILENVDFSTASTYSISVQHPKFGNAIAKTSFPRPVAIESIQLRDRRVFDNNYQELRDVIVADITFTDPAGEDNYYQISNSSNVMARVYINGYYNSLGEYVYPEESGIDTLILWTNNQFSDIQVDPLMNPGEGEIFDDSENMFQLFSGELIDGETYTLSYVVNDNGTLLSDLDTVAGEFFKVNIAMRSIPKDLYLYYLSAESFYWNDEMPFVEPVQVFSNVENGVGIVAGYHLSTAEHIYGNDSLPGKTYIDRDLREFLSH